MLKLKIMCKHAVEELPYLLKYVPDRYKTQQMCEKAILKNRRTLKSVSDKKCVIELFLKILF